LKYRFWRVAALLGALSSGFVVTSAQAFDWSIETTVSALEPSYVPNSIAFSVNAAGGSCVQGTWLTWNAVGADQPTKIANIQAVYATLLSAKLSGKTIRVFGNNSGCTIDHIHIIG